MFVISDRIGMTARERSLRYRITTLEDLLACYRYSGYIWDVFRVEGELSQLYQELDIIIEDWPEDSPWGKV